MVRDDTEFFVLERDGHGFVRVVAKDIDHDLTQAEICGAFIHAARVETGRRARVLVDMRRARSISRDARLYYQSGEREVDMLATALLVDSGVSRVLGNFIIGLNKGPMPTRLFTHEHEARAWLEALNDD